MNEFTPALVVAVIGGALALVQAARFARNAAILLIASYMAHLLSALAQVRLTQDYYGIGDLLGYSRDGTLIGRALSFDFYRFAPELFHLAVGPRASFPSVSHWAGTTTGAMMALGGVLSYLTGGGPNTFCICVAVWAYFGQVALYRFFRNALPEPFHERLLIAALLVPSCVFWASALLKESVAIGGMGFAVLGFANLRKAIRVGPAVQLLIGMATVGLVKPYILFALILGAGAWLYCDRVRGQVRLSTLVPVVLGAAVAVGGIALLTSVFPEFSIGSFAERAAAYQANTVAVEGGSNYAIGDTSQTTAAGQLRYAPLAIVTALFRPFLFEAESPQMAVSALETGVLLVLTVRAMRRRSLLETWRIVSHVPLLAFCLAFTLCLGFGVGLTTTNMGTLSRYRMPLIPFFTALVLVLDAPFFARQPPAAAGQLVPAQLRRRPT